MLRHAGGGCLLAIVDAAGDVAEVGERQGVFQVGIDDLALHPGELGQRGEVGAGAVLALTRLVVVDALQQFVGPEREFVASPALDGQDWNDMLIRDRAGEPLGTDDRPLD